MKTAEEIKKFVDKWMASQEPGTFIESDCPHEQCYYTSKCGQSSINLNYFFEELLTDYIAARQFKEQKEDVKEGKGCKHKDIRKGMHPYCAPGQMWCSDCKQYFNLTQPNK